MKTDFTNVEKIHLSSTKSMPTADPEILACARKLDKNFVDLNELTDWFSKLCPKKQADKDTKETTVKD